MTEYIVKTDKQDKKTHILKIGNPVARLGMIYTDFTLLPKIRDISKEEIINPDNNDEIGKIRLYLGGNIISVNSKRKELSALMDNGEYREEGIIIPYRKLTRQFIISKEEYKGLEKFGITHAYFLGEKSSLSKIFCFEKDGDFSGVIYSKESNDENALRGLTLALAQQIENQDFVFEFMKK
jgi:hypothetical protein